MFSFGILGNNARNLLYIKKFNPRKSIRLADNKQKTKIFLGERGIPFAETFALIRTSKELRTFDFAKLPKKEFVIKPNHGSKGRGISIVTAEENNLFRIGGKQFTETILKHQLMDILDGAYSMTSDDSILIEEKLIPGAGFEEFCTYGLADIRIIVFNLVPVASMIRVPTEKSEGKANIGSGGIGCGIDLQSGKVFSTFIQGKLYKKKFPEGYQCYQGKKIPFWDDLLFYSSKIQYFVNLGYLALDRVITEEGPKLLEINARAGLEVQKIADVRLKNVLHKIEDLHVQDPQKGVEIAKTLLGQPEEYRHKSNKILYLSQMGKLYIKEKAEGPLEEIDVEVQVDLNKQKNYLSPVLYDKIQQKEQFLHIELPENTVSLRQLEFQPSEKIQHGVVLGRSVAGNFLIKPQKKPSTIVHIIKPEVVLESETIALHQLDEKIDFLHKKLNLTAKLRPQNYLNELDNFITWKGHYSPVFSYAFPEERRLAQWKDELFQVKETCTNGSLKSSFIQLFNEKVDELFIKHQLLQAYSKQDLAGIEEGNRLLRGDFDEELVRLSKDKVNTYEDKNMLGAPLSFLQVKEKIEKRLVDLEIFGVDVVENSSNLSRISVTMGKEVQINLAQGIEFREKEIDAVIAHEIETHLVRYLNGKKSGWKIFASGTAGYLRDEEGLAIWNAKQKLPEGYESLGMWKKYYLLHESQYLNFKQLFDLVSIVYPQYSVERKFRACIRIKKGVIHNSAKQKGCSWRKNKTYLEGYEEVKKLETIDKRMFLGKMKISDLEYIK